LSACFPIIALKASPAGKFGLTQKLAVTVSQLSDGLYSTLNLLDPSKYPAFPTLPSVCVTPLLVA